jgi:hypothetical protein
MKCHSIASAAMENVVVCRAEDGLTGNSLKRTSMTLSYYLEALT